MKHSSQEPLPRNPFVREDSRNPYDTIPFRVLGVDPAHAEEITDSVEELRDPLRRALLTLLTHPHHPYDLAGIPELREATEALRQEIERSSDVPALPAAGYLVHLADALRKTDPLPFAPESAPDAEDFARRLVEALLTES